jgi:NADPH:quinone reductase-like Zn-dependent oxidoreductase
VKAVICTRYGPPDAIELKEVARPVPGDNDVLVEVRASSVNYNNLGHVRGSPLMARFWTGLLKPKHMIPGNDVAGRVEAVGRNVTQFQVGDEVYGNTHSSGYGAWAEYVVVAEDALALKPDNVSFAAAAAVPEAGLVALQALRDHGKVKSGSKVLVFGASGGVGTFAVQIAKAFGAGVTGVCSTRNLGLVVSLGADHVIDYTREDFTRSGKRYDLILATGGYRSILDYKRALTPRGRYVCTGAAMSGPKALAQVFEALLLGPFVSEKNGRRLSSMLVVPNRMDLVVMKESVEAGKVHPVVDRIYPLAQTAEALSYYSQGHSRGKVVIDVHGGCH